MCQGWNNINFSFCGSDKATLQEETKPSFNPQPTSESLEPLLPPPPLQHHEHDEDQHGDHEDGGDGHHHLQTTTAGHVVRDGIPRLQQGRDGT